MDNIDEIIADAIAGLNERIHRTRKFIGTLDQDDARFDVAIQVYKDLEKAVQELKHTQYLMNEGMI